jgi:general secretion pathway protein K
MRVSSPREGFVLVTVLWITVAATVIGTLVVRSAREALELSRNRITITQQQWRAEGCTATALALIDEMRATTGSRRSPDLSRHFEGVDWRSLGLECSLQIEAVGSRLDLEAINEEMIRRVLSLTGFEGERVDYMVDALLDWTDPDDLARPRGAEREWYDLQRRPGPRNGPLQAPAELLRIRGFEAETALVELFGVDEGPPVRGHVDMGAIVVAPGMEILDEPAAWRILARAGEVGSGPIVALEFRIALTSDRIAVVARRMWLQ